MKILNKQFGFSPLIIAVAVALILIISGVGYYFFVRKINVIPSILEESEEKKAREEKEKVKQIEELQEEKEAVKTVEELKVEMPVFDLSLSPLPSLEISALNIASPALPSSNIFPEFSVNTDFSYSGNTNISAPAVQFEYTAPKSSQTPQQQPEQSGDRQQGQVNAANCAQFSAIPTLQYCSMVSDPNGRTLCEQCKTAGF